MFVPEGLSASDLDSSVNVGFAFDELEGRVLGIGINLECFVPTFILLLVQKPLNANVEQTCVHSIQTRSHTQKLSGAGMD